MKKNNNLSNINNISNIEKEILYQSYGVKKNVFFQKNDINKIEIFFRSLNVLLSKNISYSEVNYSNNEHADLQTQETIFNHFINIFTLLQETQEYKKYEKQLEENMLKIIDLIFNISYNTDIKKGKINMVFGEGQSEYYGENIYTSLFFLEHLFQACPKLATEKIGKLLFDSVKEIYMGENDFSSTEFGQLFIKKFADLTKFFHPKIIQRCVEKNLAIKTYEGHAYKNFHHKIYENVLVTVEKNLLDKSIKSIQPKNSEKETFKI